MCLGIFVPLLAACATGLHPRTPDFDMPIAYDAAAQGKLPPAQLDRWWLLYGDAQLTSLVERAQRQGFDARAALARLQEAQAVRSAALTRFDPQGGLQGSGEERHSQDLGDDTIGSTGFPGNPGLPGSTGQSRTASLTLPVSWELDLFGRRGAGRRAADADLAAARFDYEATNAALVADVARTLFQARGLAVQLEEARAATRIQRELLNLLDRRVERGLTASSQADRVGADVAQAEAQATGLEAELKATRRVLLVLLGDGLEPLADMQVSDEIATLPVLPITLPGDLLVRRPDIRQADARVRSAAGNVRQAELDFFPRLTLQPSVGLSAQRGSFDSTTSFWSIGLGLAVPILDRPRLHSALDVQSARGQQAVVGYERAVQAAYSESDQALTRLAADRQRVTTLTEGEVRARRSYAAARKRFDLGFSGLQELLDAERSWRATRAALTSARVDALQRSVQVFQALGGGSPATQEKQIPTLTATSDPDNEN